MTVISALEGLKEDLKSKASPSYIRRPCFQKSHEVYKKKIPVDLLVLSFPISSIFSVFKN
jgi:hypothetical protein